MACGTGLVFQSAKLVADIGPMPGFKGGCANTRAVDAPWASKPITFSLRAGSAPVRLRLMAPDSR